MLLCYFLIFDSQKGQSVSGTIFSSHRVHRIRYSTFFDDWISSNTCLRPWTLILSKPCRRITAIATIVTNPKIANKACM